MGNSHYARDCRQSQSTGVIKGTINLKLNNLRGSKELKGTRGYIVKHFTFCYDNRCLVHKETKYSASYWPQKPSPDQFKSMKEEKQDCLDELDWESISTCSQKLAKIVIQRQNLYLNTDYNSLYNFNPEEETFSNIKCTKIKSYAVQARSVVQNNQRTKSVPRIEVIKTEILDINLFVDQSDYEVLEEPKYTLKTKTETVIKSKLVMRIKTPLNTISIAL